MLHNKQRRTTQFTVPGGSTIMSQEFGTIKLKLWTSPSTNTTQDLFIGQ